MIKMDNSLETLIYKGNILRKKEYIRIIGRLRFRHRRNPYHLSSGLGIVCVNNTDSMQIL